MGTNRLRPTSTDPTPPPAFVPCPAVVALPPREHAVVLEVYRLAAEFAREQLRPRRSRMCSFPVN
ncbi:hypothetical protein J0H58_36120 [bacterium]|nr:hypothetical protein [bacterium]